MNAATCIVFEAAESIALRDVYLPDPGSGEVLVRTDYSAVSPGTERRVLSGDQPGSRFPLVPGYSSAGVVIKTRSDQFAEGDRVVLGGGDLPDELQRLWGGHASASLCVASDVRQIPDGVELVEASLSKMAAIASHGVDRATPQPGERVLVLGLGLIGQIASRLFHIECETVAADVSPSRCRKAVDAGLNAIVIEPGLDKPLGEDAVERFGYFDIICDATGVERVLPHAISLLKSRDWGTRTLPPRYLIQGSYPGDFSIPYNLAFMVETTFLLPRDEGPAARKRVLRLMSEGRLRLDDLYGTPFCPAEADSAYAAAFETRGKRATSVFDWTD
jgi:2-desacetyl-2-hydroxyethyl bacteriochlorophyllide A dehydrogenase